MKRKGWTALQIVQFLCFVCVSVFFFMRKTDGHGAVQTMEAKWISFGVWAIVYIVVLAIEWAIAFVIRRSGQ